MCVCVSVCVHVCAHFRTLFDFQAYLWRGDSFPFRLIRNKEAENGTNGDGNGHDADGFYDMFIVLVPNCCPVDLALPSLSLLPPKPATWSCTCAFNDFICSGSGTDTTARIGMFKKMFKNIFI